MIDVLNFVITMLICMSINDIGAGPACDCKELFIQTIELVFGISLTKIYQTGATSPEILELLLSTYQDVGDIFCGLRSFRQRFLECSEMQEILEIFFFNILELHHATLDTFGKQGKSAQWFDKLSR